MLQNLYILQINKIKIKAKLMDASLKKVTYCKVDFEGLKISQKGFYESKIKERLDGERATIAHIIKDDNPKNVEKYILSENKARAMEIRWHIYSTS